MVDPANSNKVQNSKGTTRTLIFPMEQQQHPPPHRNSLLLEYNHMTKKTVEPVASINGTFGTRGNPFIYVKKTKQRTGLNIYQTGSMTPSEDSSQNIMASQ